MPLTVEQIRVLVRSRIEAMSQEQANTLIGELANCLAVGGDSLEEQVSELVSDIVEQCREEDEHLPCILAYGYLIHMKVLP